MVLLDHSSLRLPTHLEHRRLFFCTCQVTLPLYTFQIALKMNDFDAISTAMSINEGVLPSNSCHDCGCYKGKPCGRSSIPTEGSEPSRSKDEKSFSEEIPQTTSNITPFVRGE